MVQVSGFDGTGGFFIKIQNIQKFDDDLKKIFGKKKFQKLLTNQEAGNKTSCDGYKSDF